MKKEKQMMFLMALLLCLAHWPCMAFAEGNSYEAVHKGSITVSLDEIGTERGGVTLYGYLVGKPKNQMGSLAGWMPEERFSSLDLDLNDLEETQKHRKAVQTLEEFIEEEGIFPIMEGMTDENGQCRFENLEQGMYLICQQDGFDRYGTIEDFLVPVPYAGADLLLYDVQTETKGAVPIPLQPTEEPSPSKTPSPSEEPTPSEPPESGEPFFTPIPPADVHEPMETSVAEEVKTGDTTPVGAFAALAALALGCAGFTGFLRWKNKNR